MTRISSARMDMEGGRVDNAFLRTYGETAVTANSSTSYAVDLSTGNTFSITMTGNCTFTFINPDAAGVLTSFTLMLTQDATGGRTAAWPGSVVWPAGIAVALRATSNNTDVFTFSTYDGGVNWYGFVAAQNMKLPPFWLAYGYFAGGTTNGANGVVTLDRIDYSNDTATAVAKGPLSQGRQDLAATGNSSFGYFGGGYTGSNRSSRVDRIDYSNDTATLVAKGPLSAARYELAAAGTSSFGYFGGGDNGPASLATVDRVDYSNDTATLVTKGPLSAAKSLPAATGTSSFGYFGGGQTPAVISTVDRIDYSNDTATAVTKGPLSQVRYRLAATGTSSFGYFGGGASAATPAVVFSSRIDRIDYSNDTLAAVAKGPLSAARYRLAATGTSSFGYFGGGATGTAGPAQVVTVDRIDYSNDTATAVTEGPLSAARRGLAATNHTSLL